jgi:hypothetical protein
METNVVKNNNGISTTLHQVNKIASRKKNMQTIYCFVAVAVQLLAVPPTVALYENVILFVPLKFPSPINPILETFCCLMLSTLLEMVAVVVYWLPML